MFGYVKPLACELKMREYEQFRAFYCGLCHALNGRYGFAGRLVLNYDFVFMAMLLADADGPPLYEYKRCIVSPFKKRACCGAGKSMEAAADYSIILTYWKLQDSIADDGFVKSLSKRLFAWLLSGAYGRAVDREPEFGRLVREKLAELGALETEKCASMDITADKFALILQGAAETVSPEPRRRTLRELFYHTGRVVYLLDAVDDLKRDALSGAYNPLLYRFDAVDGVLSDTDKQTALMSVEHSQMLMASAFELLDANPWTGILSNIIYAGIPWVSDLVFSGKWEKPRRGLPKSAGTHPDAEF